MCGRFTLTTDPGVVARRFGAPPTQGGGTTPRYNVAPTQTVVTVTAEGERRLEQMRWGLVPRWAKSPEIGSRLINARAETLAEKPAFREALRRRRALIPADGFYEWATASGPRGEQQSKGQSKGQPKGSQRGQPKQPMHVRLRSGEPFAFAGLWEEWTPPAGGPPLRTCTIVTTAPNSLLATFHHRMPVILTPEAEGIWLDPQVTDPERLLPLLAPFPAEVMEAYPVSQAVNAVGNDSAQLLLPLDLAA
jgi:putative SOS response-associated peptidase YedK